MYARVLLVVTMNSTSGSFSFSFSLSLEELLEEGEEDSRKPRPVMGSVGDSWMVFGFGRAESEVEPEKSDWSRFR